VATQVWDAESGDLVLSLEGHSQRVHALAVYTEPRAGSGRIVTGSRDATIRVRRLSPFLYRCDRGLLLRRTWVAHAVVRLILSA
jgi:WD40 repeat protein